ncbi:hypothetical protein LINPERPRIM_LOCUS37003 [Linum perenne]
MTTTTSKENVKSLVLKKPRTHTELEACILQSAEVEENIAMILGGSGRTDQNRGQGYASRKDKRPDDRRDYRPHTDRRPEEKYTPLSESQRRLMHVLQEKQIGLRWPSPLSRAAVKRGNPHEFCEFHN